MNADPVIAERVIRFGLTTRDAARLIDFYERAFGCRLLSSEHIDGAQFERTMQVTGGAQRHQLRLDDQIIELLQFDIPGAPYPADLSPLSPIFQHFAVAVADMERALSHLRQQSGWAPITRGASQQLPESSGGVRAYKFRDPDGHPLEFLEFPRNRIPPQWQDKVGRTLFCGVDHSAVSVADTARSVEFFRELGFKVSGHTYNHGREQECLDGVRDAHVEVTALAAARPSPHIELLCYHTDPACARYPRGAWRSNDVAATRLVIEYAPIPDPGHSIERLIVDPDGHHLLLVPR